MEVDGPVSMKVSVESRLDATNTMTFETEFVVADEDEAQAKGDQFVRLMKAFNTGFGDA